jgi:hypothetical protein
VFFSAYEIIRKSAITTVGPDNADKTIQCATATATYAMPFPFSFEYSGADVNGQLEVNADVTGDVNPAFLNIVNVTNAIAGSWVAEPTVVVVMSRIVAVSQSYLSTPTPTLLSGFSRNTASGAQQTVALPASSVDWATALSLQLPDTAYAAQLTGPTTPSKPSSSTRSAAINTASPTNALEVLSQALETYDQPSSTPSNALEVLQQAKWTATATTSSAFSSTSTRASAVTTTSASLSSPGVALADASATVRTGDACKLLPERMGLVGIVLGVGMVLI